MSNLNLQPRRLKLRECEIALFETHLNREARLICVHGGPGLDHSSLLPGLEEMAEQFDLTFLDLRGHGLSSEPQDSDYTLDSYASDILQITNEYPRQSLGLFGHSFGGSVVLRTLAQQTQENSSKQIEFAILCSAPIDREYQSVADSAISKHVKDRSIAEINRKFSANSTDDFAYKELMMDLGPLYFPEWPREKIESEMSKWIFRVKPYNFAEKDIFPTLDSVFDCHTIKIPMLVIGGEQDDLIPWSHLERFQKEIEDSTLVKISGGHFPFSSNSKEFCKQIFHWWKNKRKDQSNEKTY